MPNGIADIIVLAVIAGALIVQLVKTLGGKKFDPDDSVKEHLRKQGETFLRAAEEDDNDQKRAGAGQESGETLNEEELRFAEQMAQARKYDRDFSLPAFRKGAERAFAMVVSSYAKGDAETLKQLCTNTIYEGFLNALAERRAAGREQETTVVKVASAECVAFRIEKAKAEITLHFTSEQISCTRDSEGASVAGHPSRIVRQEDVWSFERNLRDANPNWKLCRTGEALPSAPETPKIAAAAEEAGHV